MIIAKFIVYLSIFIWLLPPLKQFGGRFFYFFLILALSDPVAMAVNHLTASLPLNIVPVTTYALVSLALLVSLPQSNKYLKLSYVIPILAVSFIAIICLSLEDSVILIGVIHILILYVLIKYVINYTFINGRIQLFHLLLITYEISVLLKFINKIFHMHTGLIEFYFITGFQIILGIMFSLLKEENPRTALKMP